MQSIVKYMAIILITGFVAMANAEEVKFAVVDVQAAVSGADEVKAILAQLKSEFSEEEIKIKSLQAKLQELKEKQAKDSAIMSEAENRRLMEEASQLTNEYKFIAQQLQRRAGLRQQELLTPIIERAEKAVQEVMDEGGYSLVFRKEALVDYKGDADITKLVTAKINQPAKLAAE